MINSLLNITIVDVKQMSSDKFKLDDASDLDAVILFVSYTGGLFKKAFKKDLEENDIYEVIKSCKSETTSDRVAMSWKKRIRDKGHCSLFWLLWKNFGTQFALLSLINLIWKLTNRYGALNP